MAKRKSSQQKTKPTSVAPPPPTSSSPLQPPTSANLPFETGPEKLSTSKFRKGLSSTRQRVVALLGFIAALATLAACGLAYVAILPQQQQDMFLLSIGALSPSPFPTLEFAAAKEGEILVIVAEFDRQETQTATSKTMYKQLEASLQNVIDNPQLRNLPIRMVHTATVITTREAAKTIAETNNATIVIWGSVATSILTTNYEITPRWGQEVDTLVEQTEFNATLSNISLIDQITYHFENAIDQQYVTIFTLAQILYSSQKYEAALPLLKSLTAQMQLESDSIKREYRIDAVWFYIGYIRREIQKDEKSAEQAYTESLHIGPAYAETYSNRGVAIYNQGKLDEAIVDFTKAIYLNSEFPDAYSNRCLAFSDQGNLKAAIIDCTDAIRLDPEFAVAYLNRGLALYKQEKLVEAIADYNEALRLNSEYAEAYNNRGVALYKKGDLAGAIADYDEALRLNPKFADARNNRGATLAGQGKLGEALIDFTEALRLNPEFASAYNNRGLALYDQGKYEEALIDFTKALRLNPEFADTYYNRGITFHMQGKIAEAITDYDETLRLDPEYSAAYWALGKAYYDQKRFQESLKNFRHYLELAGNNPNESIIEIVEELEIMLGTPSPS